MSDYVIFYEDELQHHGILGQKWGVRRFQNKDGSLKSAGIKRYAEAAGKSYRKNHRMIGTVSSFFRSGGAPGIIRGIQGGGKGREARLAKKLETKSDKMSDKKKAKLENKLQAQKKLNADREKYDAQISTGKMIVQDALLSYYNAEKYRNARARGASRLRAYFESGAIDPISAYLRYQGNKKAYGDGMAAGAMDGTNF